ncbi:hypothetical protein QBC40DRAFT_288070 [Triangularia verruculosa]|uniref:Uncharacterized protein n=1 Tax=Triangularia verruculosa TaxID=2587418 RepID=A0AAN7AQV4_9PEZI|nr:hypothetical protein QBC40DRAFT_288070 [Triangularia verruculosa]
MATQHIPGAFPASIPPTPADEPVQQPTQQHHEEQDQSHHHRERNKLHKPNDPRGHAHTDSGVGFTEPEPNKRNNDRWVGPSEAVGGGTYVREEDIPYRSSQPVQPLSESRQLAQENSQEEFPIRRTRVDEQPVGATVGAAAVGTGAVSQRQTTPTTAIDNTETTPRPSHEQPSDPPYWGDLPKASSGGIYNTVTGHGSAKDDHDQHHHLPQRGTGVYNSVSGHGSQDRESRRHSQSGTSEDRNVTAGGPAGAVLAAPLSEIPEGQQKQTFTSPASETNRSNAPPSSLPLDNALVAAPGSAPTDREVDKSRQSVSSSPTQRAFPLSSAKNNRDEDATPTLNNRNNALAGTAALGAGAMAYGVVDKNKKDKEVPSATPSESQAMHSRSASEDHGSRATGGLFSRKSRDDRRNSSVDKHRSRSRSVHGEKKPKVLGIFHRHKDEETPREDTSTYEPPAQSTEHRQEPVLVGSTTGTTKTRNRLRKGSRSEPKERRVSSNSPTENDNLGHNKAKAAAGAAAGAGAFGLMHHKKDKDGKAIEDQPVTTHAVQHQSPTSSSHPTQPAASHAAGNTTQVNQPEKSGTGVAAGLDALKFAHKPDAAHPVTGTATPAGLGTHKHDDPSTPFEHPREPPSPPRNDERGSQSWVPAAVIGTAASGAPSAMKHSKRSSAVNPTTSQHTDTDVVYNTLPSGATSGAQRNSANTSPRGSATHPIDAQRPVANAPGDYNVFVSSGQPLGSSHPLESNKAQRRSSAQEPTYNHLASSTPSGVALGSGRQSESQGSRGGAVTQEPGTYNHLPSGTASGIATAGIAAAGVAAHRSARGSESTAHQGTVTQEAGQYNHLATGTDSGIKRESGAAEGSRAHNLASAGSSRPSQNRTDSGPYNKLPSGTPSGVKIKPKENSRRATEPAVHAHGQHSADRNVSLPAGQTGAVLSQHHQSHPSNIDTRADDLKDLPLPASSSSPTNAHTSSHHTVVSPPVHAPETGKATNPPPAAGQSITPHVTPFPSTVKGMSPEVMPKSYRESASKPHEQAHTSSHHTGVSPSIYAFPETGKAINPPAAGQAATPRFTPFPNTVKGMSPEVMPESYLPRESNPSARGMQAMQSNEMSPEVMSKEYTEKVTGQNKFVGPALAAATGAWAATAGPSSGKERNVGLGGGVANVPQGKVMHRCEHCGQDNDISGYVKQAVAKITGVDKF